MEKDQANISDINGVNLDNYFPYQRTYDTVTYVHKRVLRQDEANEESKVNKAKAEKKMKDKNVNATGSKINGRTRNESVLEQTVRFAKHLAPIVIPPNERSNTPVFYTVETCSKCRKKDKKPEDVPDDTTYKKKTCKKIIESYRNHRSNGKKHSITESVSHSSGSSTLDDTNINQSLSCTISEQSDKREKHTKNEVNSKRKRHKDKFIISESFEAVATEFTDADDTRIKVQLMNNAEKNAFCDSIRSPVLSAIRECMTQYNNIHVNEEVKKVQRLVKCNTDKLDKILDRLTYIEEHLQNKEHTKVNTKSPRLAVTASLLEQLGEDIDDEKSYDEEFESIKRNKIRHEDNSIENRGGGEVMHTRASTSVGVKTDKPNRIPARFCWTDADKH